MKQSFAWMLLAMTVVSCRNYNLESRLESQSGLIPADRFAKYGREQAQEIAIAREFARAGDTSYARSLPDVQDAKADPLGFRQTIHFKSGWLTMVVPIDDGKRGAETPGVPAEARPAPQR